MRAIVIIGVFAALLCGCASQQMSIRRLPPDTATADNAAAAESAAELAATIATEAMSEAGQGSAIKVPAVTPADAPSMHTYDPWERLNRFTYRFNTRFDEMVFLPVANGYRRLPAAVRSGVHNFFGNLAEVDSVINYALQWRVRYGVQSLGRFVINSTLGLGGLFDVAKELKLAAEPTGLSTTLSRWGMHPGPYLVIPFLGPSTLRDGIGVVGDYGASHVVNVANLYRGNEAWFLSTSGVIDQRANSSFRYYATGSPFEYETIRFLYVRKRLIEDGGVHPKNAQKQRNSGASLER